LALAELKKGKFMLKKLSLILLVICAFCQITFSQATLNQTQMSLDSVATIYTTIDGNEVAVGSGIILSSNGFVLTPHHIVKNATQISIKIHNGEMFDNAKIVSKDERRNVALLQVVASGLKPLSMKTIDEGVIGRAISIISNTSGSTSRSNEGTLSGIQLADGIVGAGNGYRVYSIETKSNENLVGGLLLNESGNSIGIITTNPNVKLQNIAVPFSSISGLLLAANIETVAPKTTISNTKTLAETKPVATMETENKPGRSKAHQVLRSAQTIYVHSKTGYIRDSAFIAELMKNTDFTEWGWSFTNNRETADLVLEVDRLAFVIKFTFKVYSIKHGVIIASGNTHTNDFDFGSPDLVRAIIGKLKTEWLLSK
jgi:Trypsin-like peptidase domain